MPKVVDRDARRRDIAAKAVAVLVREGLRDINLGQIADECGLARSTLYESFKNLDELVDFALGETMDRLEAQALGHPGDDPVDRVRAFLHHHVRVAIQEKGAMVLLLDDLLHPHRQTSGRKFDSQARVRRLRSELAGLLQTAVEAGALVPMDCSSMGFTLFALVETATIHAVYYDSIGLDGMVGDIDRLLDGLRRRD